MSDEIMTVKDLAIYLKLNYQTIYKKVQKNQIPGNKIGSSWRFHKNVIDRWFAENATVKKP